MPSLCVVAVVLVEIVRSGRLGQSFATLGSRKLFLIAYHTKTDKNNLSFLVIYFYDAMIINEASGSGKSIFQFVT